VTIGAGGEAGAIFTPGAQPAKTSQAVTVSKVCKMNFIT
jgi:hypothetical protein